MKGAIKIFVGGSSTYFGNTVERDRWVVRECAFYLFKKVGDEVTIVTDGSTGVGNDFVDAWHEAGGKSFTVYCLIPLSESPTFNKTYPNRHHLVGGHTSAQNRVAISEIKNLQCGLFIQGGEDTRQQIQLFQTKKIPIIAFCGSGGACHGLTTLGHDREGIWTTDPNIRPKFCAAVLISEILAILNPLLPAHLK